MTRVDRGESPPEKRWAGASPDAEPHHQQPAGTTRTDQAQDIAAWPAISPVYSRQVSWWPVNSFVTPVLAAVDSWPMIGTPQWCELPDDDARKIAAVYDAARHWALHVDINQQAMADVGSEISASADWPAIAREINQRTDFYAARPWLKRVAS